MSLIHGLHHVALRAGDFDRSVAFYTDVLGFATKIAWGEKPARAVMLDAGDGNYVEVFERPGDPPATDDPPTVLLHFAIRTHDVDAATERAREAGCRITMEPKDVDIPTTVGPHPTPVRIAFFRGPDNEEIELFQNELT
jgi:catechol 2,3-dioxygenase-like lactoylglutathione lyase family enzyme